MPHKKMGRPPLENPMVTRIQIRVDDATLQKLNKCAERLKKTRSDVIRQGIDFVYDALEK